MSRFAVRIGSALAILALIVLTHSPARANDRLVLRLNGRPIVFTHVRIQESTHAVAADDSGVQQFLARIGATVTWQPGERYVLFTSAEPVVVSFALGDPQYDVGPVRETAPFAPFLLDGHPYVPLEQLIHSLDFAIKADGAALVLQPQIASIDLQGTADQAKIVVRAGIPLDGRIVSQSDNRIVLAFDGVGSILPPSRAIAGGPVQRIDVRTAGTVTHPQTQVTLVLAPGTIHTAPGTDDQRDFTVGLERASGQQTIAQSAPQSSPSAEAATPVPSPSTSGATPTSSLSVPVQVTAVDMQSKDGSVVVHVSVNGSTTYEWHRLRPPDNRLWLDLHNARLGIPPQDEPGVDAVSAVRVHQVDPNTVRVALSLTDFEMADVTTTANGVDITIGSIVAEESSAPREGAGIIGSATANVLSTPENWKFGNPQSTPVAANPRLIVIDPGHGGSDAGSVHGGIMEKTITLAISERLRDVLVSRGWQVVMTRTTDRDVYKPDDDADDELQARDDVANSRGARLFVSIHANAYINAGPHGATVYYYKPSELGLAQAVDERIASELGIKNNGVIKYKYYVVHHAQMPATLIETAFISNPDDRALLTSPEWQQKMAVAIADGIADYAGPPTKTPASQPQ